MYQAAVVIHVVSAVTWLGPMIIERLDQAPDAGLPPPRRVVLLTARVNLLAVLAIVVLAVLLIRP